MTSASKPRIDPLLPSEWSDAETEALCVYPRPFELVMSGWREQGALIPGGNAVCTLARNPALAKAFLTLNAHASTASSLSGRVSELVILRLAWLLKCEYAFVRHVVAGRRHGLSEAEIERIQAGPDVAGWDALDAALVRTVDELVHDTYISNATWETLAAHFESSQLLDLIFLLGCYWSMSMMMKNCRIQLESAATPLEPEVRTRMLAG